MSETAECDRRGPCADWAANQCRRHARWSRVTRCTRGAGASRSNSKHRFDLALTHPVEIVRDSDLARKKPEAMRLGRGLERGHFDQRLARLGDHERLALRGPVDQLGELGLRFV